MIVLTWAGYCFSGLFGVLALAAAIGAFVRLKSSASGLLLGLGFGMIGLVSLLGPIQRVVSTVVAADEGGLDSLSNVQNLYDSCGHVVSALAWIGIALGLAMLPKSLARLRDNERDRPAQF